MRKYELTGSTKELKNLNYYVYKNVSKTDFGFDYVYPTDLKKLIPDTEVINYVSVLPGVGKTHWARKVMKKGSIKKDYIYLFIAPTKLLLKEVYKDLKNELDPSVNCDVFYIKDKDSFNAQDFTLTDKFLDSLSLAKKGDILLITHALYLNLPELDNKQKIFAIFDEAQMIGIKSNNITLDQKDLTYFKENTYLELIASQDRPKNIKGNIDGSYVEKYFKVHGMPTVLSNYKKRSKDQFNKHFYDLLKNSISPKLNVYVMPKGTQLSFFSFTSPKHSFKGFAKIYLMGAFFNLSELYHILIREGHILRDMSTKVNLDRQTKIRERFMGLSILPILDLDRHLSLSLLKDQLVIKPKVNLNDLTKDFTSIFTKMSKKLEKNKYKNSDIKYKKPSSILKHIFLGNRYNRNIDCIVEPLRKKYSDKLFDVFEHLMDICVKNLDTKKQPLLITNVIKKLYTNKDIKLKVLTPNIHGLNKYKDRDTLIFMAAINAIPTLNLFYSHFIPEFSQEEHMIAANIVQAVCRLNVRDINSEENTLLIVPTTKTAQLIRRIMRPYLIIESIECLDPLAKLSFLNFKDLVKVNAGSTKNKNYLVLKKKGDLLETRLTTEQKFMTFPDYRELAKEYTKIMMIIKRFGNDKNSIEFKKLLDRKIKIAEDKKKLRKIIAKRENFTEYRARNN